MTDQISFPPLLDLSPGELEAQKQHLLSEIARDDQPLRLPLFGAALPSLRLSRPRQAVIAVAACAGAAALVGVFAFPGSTPQVEKTATSPSTTSNGIRSGAVLGRIATPMPVSQALSVASKSFGAPVFLPDTAQVKPSDADQGYLQWLPASQPGEQTPVSQLNVDFRVASYLNVEYTPTDLTSCGSGVPLGSTEAPCDNVYPNALDEYKAEIAKTPTHAVDGRTPPTFQIVNLTDGTPALITTGHSGNDIQFRDGPLSINIWAPNNNGTPTTFSAADLQALAQSIVDQSGAGSSG